VSVLDPRDPAPAVRRRVDAWLAVQDRLAWRPEEAAPLLAEDPDPESVLRRLVPTGPGRSELARARRLLAGVGARLVPLPSPAYPPRLRERLVDPPPVLAVRGDPAALHGPVVSVVGARAATRYGRDVARALGRDLAAAGVVVVSGLARGVDAAAHEGALEAGGRSAALLGSGVDRIYPPEHRGLAERLVAAGGAVASELPAGTAPRAPHFPLRNRLLAGLAEAVVVVEARPRSGSLVTARHAADRSVDLWAVPGPVDAVTSRGSNALLRDGGYPLVAVEDLLASIGVEARRGGASVPARATPARSPDARAVLELLGEGPLAPDALARRLGLAPPAFAAALLELELDGAVATDRDGRLRRRTSATPGGALRGESPRL
jgi:DNA processing protein